MSTQIDTLNSIRRTIVHNMASASAGFYNSKELNVETTFTGERTVKVVYTVSGRRNGKIFHSEHKSCDRAIVAYNKLCHV